MIAAILPTSVLDSAWFELLAAFVAFNTLVYAAVGTHQALATPSTLTAVA